MSCIKCGVETAEMQVFCENCLAEMEKYPVKPDVTVTLPHREEFPSQKKKPRRQKSIPAEEQLRRTKYVLRLTRITLVVVFVCFLLVSAMLLQYLS